jgi:hypothetical protein
LAFSQLDLAEDDWETEFGRQDADFNPPHAKLANKWVGMGIAALR